MQTKEEEKSSDDQESSKDELREPIVVFFSRWGKSLLPPDVEHPPPQKTSAKESYISLKILKVLPYLCLILFITSLFWDLHGSVQLPWRATPVSLEGLLRMVAVAGLIGYGTNWVAIKMLFYPRKKRPLLGQGLIPSRKDYIVTQLADSISKEIINSELILQEIKRSGLIAKHYTQLTDSLRATFQNDDFKSDLILIVKYYFISFLQSSRVQEEMKSILDGFDFKGLGVVEGVLFKFYSWLKGEKVYDRVIQILGNSADQMDFLDKKLDEYLKKIPDLMEVNSRILEEYVLKAVVFFIEQVNVKNVVLENLSRFDEIRLEQLLLKSTSNQLQYIQVLGALLGIIGGFFIWMPIESVIVSATLVSIIWLSDYLLIKFRNN